MAGKIGCGGGTLKRKSSKERLAESSMDQNFDIQSYMTRGVERVVSGKSRSNPGFFCLLRAHHIAAL